MSLLKDWRLIFSLILAHVLLYVTFSDRDIFWYIYTAANLFFISFAIISEPIDDKQRTRSYLKYGVLSGLVLYALFFIGHWLLPYLPFDWDRQVASIYNRYAPEFSWHYIVLILVFIPGEELFWRGFVQKRLSLYFNDLVAIVAASLLFASIFIYSGNFIWMAASFAAGLFWGALYVWKRSIPMLIISHLVFDLLLIILLPLS
ncbi:CPBP family intramembrane glutamic endopeptidase [Bacillus thermotolerans]|uniref:CAAX amino terminal protease family protein n=1 Tax=Bacillus thermotolerans TaxID=1221996 RepID=A0A0F5I104_BACTR|nr:type II CAAX endopeptidase family protein [Bacillus thermotolerans]KKB39168.1 CAAX amino terminal protease family protein [Bacillus thermotolerans]KKB42560.1 CAAX amino terminal protease family protein [Bacillus thermotolerans]KKB42645.1 CAAX amino terminal protease family protein [Bacillus thermotolerans]